MTPLFLRPRPLKTAWRFSSSSPAFVLPCVGIWAVTSIGSGGGSGATHSSYASPSERGSNGAVGNFPAAFRRSVPRSITIGSPGVAGSLTNNSDVTAQRGKDGGDTDTGSDVRSGGSGGRCAFEATGLNPSPPTGSYPSTAYSNSSVSSGSLLGVFQYGGAPSSSAGVGAPGKA